MEYSKYPNVFTNTVKTIETHRVCSLMQLKTHKVSDIIFGYQRVCYFDEQGLYGGGLWMFLKRIQQEMGPGAVKSNNTWMTLFTVQKCGTIFQKSPLI